MQEVFLFFDKIGIPHYDKVNENDYQREGSGKMLNTEIRLYKTINHGEKEDEQNESNFIIL